MLEDNLAKTSSMLLLEISKLAELLKRDLTTQKMSALDTPATRVKIQQTLFEHLTQYQKSHAEFRLSEKYLSVLTKQQVQQQEQQVDLQVAEDLDNKPMW